MKYCSVLWFLLASAGPVLADPWATVGDWTVDVDAAAGNGCYAHRALADETVVQIGNVPARDGGFFAVFNAEWTTIEDGAEAVLTFDFEDTMFQGQGVGRFWNGLPGGYAFFDNPNFVDEFGDRLRVTVWGDTRDNAKEIDLTGSNNAIEAVRDCQEAQSELSN